MLKLNKLALSNRLNLKGNKRPIVLSVLAIAAMGLIGWVILGDNLNLGKKIYAQAAGHKIYEQEVQDLIGNSKGVSDHDAAKVLADKYLVETLADEQGISISDQEIEAEYGPEINKQRGSEKFFYQSKVNQLYFERLSAHNQGIYKGKLLVAHFSRFIAFDSPLLEEDKAAEPRIGNPAATAQDKKYARDFINNLYNDINSGRISFDEAIKIEQKDPRLGSNAYPSLSHSGIFDTSNGPNGLISPESISSQISNIKPGELSGPFVVKVPNSLDGDSEVESYFLVIQMDKASGGSNTKDFRQYLEEAEKRLGYKIYV